MSAKNYIEIDYSEVHELEAKIKKLPGNVERIINSFLHREGIDQTVVRITYFMPISNPREPKRHAKLSKWSKKETFNLGFAIKAVGGAANKPGSFGYLVFPNEGRGPRNPLEQRFMERGLNTETPSIIRGLNDIIDIRLKEEFE